MNSNLSNLSNVSHVLNVLKVSDVFRAVTALCLIAVLGTGCQKESSITIDGGAGGGSERLTYEDGPLQGMIDGQAWIMTSGTAKADFLSADKYRISFSDKVTADPCNDFGFGQKQVLTSVSKTPGETVLGAGDPMASATFAFTKDGANQNLVTTNGKIQILQVTAEKIVGQTVIVLDGNNVVNGLFEIPVCAEGSAL